MYHPKISVIVPVYNTENYIEKCINSIRENTYRNLEIICVDDGSTDRSFEILSELATKDDRIVLTHQQNGGAAKARNTGLELATGELISFVDSDDWISIRFFETMMTEIGSADMIICRYKEVMNEKEQNISQKPSAVKTLTTDIAIKRIDVISFVRGKIYRRACLAGLRFNENLTREEDMFFNYQVLPNCRQIKCIDSFLYYYRYRSDSLWHTMNSCESLNSVREFVKLSESEPQDSSFVLIRAYRLLLRYGCNYTIQPGQAEYAELTELKEKKKKQNNRLSLVSRVFYTIMAECPWLFRLANNIRKKIKGRSAT